MYARSGRTSAERDAVEWACEAERRGAGEILLTSIDRDGTKAGFDCALTAAVSSAVSIPVIASGGAGTLDHFHDATIPVLTGAHLESQINGVAAKFEHLLCSLALDENSRGTLAVAARLASDLRAKLGIVHAIGVQDARLATNFGADWESRLVAMGKSQIHELQEEFGTTADVFVKMGKPGEVICQVAASVHCDLIIVGRRTGGGTFNSDAYDVIRHSPCPVISV